MAYDLPSGSWAWNDASDASAAALIRGYVAEREVSVVPEPATLSLLAVGGIAARLARRRRKAR